MTMNRSLLCIASLLLLAAVAQAEDYTGNGPCATEEVKYDVKVAAKTTANVVVTLPTATPGANCPAGPWPLVLFFSGFASPLAVYKPFAAKLASYGYAVHQYNAGLLPVADKVELRYLPILLARLANETASPSLAARVDTNTVATAGHSRGGKLAALHLAANTGGNIKTAFLIDPVDNTLFSPVSANYPSAVAALNATSPKKVAGVAGAGITGSCNPRTANFRRFYSALGSGSWLQELPKATHTAFLGAVDGGLTSAFCGKAPADAAPSTTVQSVTNTAMAAWMEKTIRNKPMEEFLAWAASQTAVFSLTQKA